MSNKKNKGLNIVLWIAQILLGAAFLMAGVMKSSQPIEELSQTVPWTAQVPMLLVRFIGVTEFLGGLGILLPSLLRIKPILSAYAALGILVVMVLAFIYHLVLSEFNALPINLVFGAIAFFIYWGRSKKVLIPSRM